MREDLIDTLKHDWIKIVDGKEDRYVTVFEMKYIYNNYNSKPRNGSKVIVAVLKNTKTQAIERRRRDGNTTSRRPRNDQRCR